MNRGAAAFLALVMFGAVAPALLRGTTDLRYGVAVELASWLTLLYVSARLAWTSVGAREDLFGVCFWSFVYVAVGVVPLVQLGSAGFPWPGAYSGDEIARAYLIVWIGLLSYESGLAVLSNRQLPQEAGRGLLKTVPVGYFKVLLVGSLAATPVLVFFTGGTWQEFFVPRSTFLDLVSGRLGLSGYSVYTSAIRVPPVVALLGLLFGYVKLRIEGLRVWILLAAAAVLVTSNPVITPRYWVGTVVLAAAFIVIPWRGRRSGVFFMIALVSGFTLVFPILDAFRFEVSGLSQGAAGSLSTSTRAALASGEFDSFQQTLNSVRYYESRGPTLGGQLATALLFAVPRSMWSGKSVHTGEMLAREQGYGYTNLGAPLWAEGFVEFGYGGTAVFLFLWGMFTRWIRAVGRDGTGTAVPTMAILYALLAPYQFFVLRGSLAVAFAFFTPACVLLVLSGVAARLRL